MPSPRTAPRPPAFAPDPAPGWPPAPAPPADHGGPAAAPPAASSALGRVRRQRVKSPKAAIAADCLRLEQLPNIGPAMAADLRALGILHPQDLARHDAYALYQALCRHTGRRQDPCVLDTFLAATDFMRGAPPAPWWAYTAQRKQRYADL